MTRPVPSEEIITVIRNTWGMITGVQACDAEDEPPLATSQHGAKRYAQSCWKAQRVGATVVPDVRHIRSLATV